MRKLLSYFLKGLLTKSPEDRLTWPDLLNHPFIKETEQEKIERKKRLEKYNQWAGLDHLPRESNEEFQFCSLVHSLVSFFLESWLYINVQIWR